MEKDFYILHPQFCTQPITRKDDIKTVWKRKGSGTFHTKLSKKLPRWQRKLPANCSLSTPGSIFFPSVNLWRLFPQDFHMTYKEKKKKKMQRLI